RADPRLSRWPAGPGGRDPATRALRICPRRRRRRCRRARGRPVQGLRPDHPAADGPAGARSPGDDGDATGLPPRRSRADGRAHALTSSLLVNTVGTAAALCSMASFVPQIIKIWRERDAQSVSLRMYAVTVTGFSLWIAYGVLSGSWPVAVS